MMLSIEEQLNKRSVRHSQTESYMEFSIYGHTRNFEYIPVRLNPPVTMISLQDHPQQNYNIHPRRQASWQTKPLYSEMQAGFPLTPQWTFYVRKIGPKRPKLSVQEWESEEKETVSEMAEDLTEDPYNPSIF